MTAHGGQSSSRASPLDCPAMAQIDGGIHEHEHEQEPELELELEHEQEPEEEHEQEQEQEEERARARARARAGARARASVSIRLLFLPPSFPEFSRRPTHSRSRAPIACWANGTDGGADTQPQPPIEAPTHSHGPQRTSTTTAHTAPIRTPPHHHHHSAPPQRRHRHNAPPPHPRTHTHNTRNTAAEAGRDGEGDRGRDGTMAVLVDASPSPDPKPNLAGFKMRQSARYVHRHTTTSYPPRSNINITTLVV